MAFKNQAQEQAYKKLAEYLPAIVGEDNVHTYGGEGFWILQGSAAVRVQANAWGEHDATVICWATVVSDVQVTSELMRFLLEANENFRFGAFSLMESGEVAFNYQILASNLDKAQLKTAVKAVAYTADEMDDQVIARFGGKTAVAVIREEMARREQQRAGTAASPSAL